MRLMPALLFTVFASLALDVSAQIRIYCCDDADGRKVCGDFLPPACQGRAYEERDNRGFVSKSVEAPLTAEQLARREAEKARKEAADKKAAEERRRTLALLSTYSNEKDIDKARDRSLAEIEKNMKQSQARLEEANKKKKKLELDKEFYKGKIVPDPVKAQIGDNDKEIKAQQTAVEGWTKEMAEVRGRFADEKKRYLELTGKKPADATVVGAKPAETTVAAPAAATPPVAAPVVAKPAEKK